ncbi:MAG: hypothetical protein IH991_22140 [Planctomycetes bacterium]|nr:hypothetical protein [Planctomycetota bacterium]
MIAKETQLVVQIANVHEECGQPPALHKTAGDGKYLGYFENSFGEQWVIEIDRAAQTGILRGGDVGWDELILIADNQINSDVVLGDDEYAWASRVGVPRRLAS